MATKTKTWIEPLTEVDVFTLTAVQVELFERISGDLDAHFKFFTKHQFDFRQPCWAPTVTLRFLRSDQAWLGQHNGLIVVFDANADLMIMNENDDTRALRLPPIDGRLTQNSKAKHYARMVGQSRADRTGQRYNWATGVAYEVTL